MTIYVVFGTTSEYAGHQEWRMKTIPVKAFRDERDAMLFVSDMGDFDTHTKYFYDDVELVD